MSLKMEQIEHGKYFDHPADSDKWHKKQRNRKMRRMFKKKNFDEKPMYNRYKGWVW